MKKISLTLPIRLIDMLSSCPDRQLKRVGFATQIDAICRGSRLKGVRPRVTPCEKGDRCEKTVELSEMSVEYLRSFPRPWTASKVLAGLIEDWVASGGRTVPKPRSLTQGFLPGNPGGGYKRGKKYGPRGSRPDLKCNGLAAVLMHEIKLFGRNDISYRDVRAIAAMDYRHGSFFKVDSGYIAEVIMRIDQQHFEA
jgi:hypothetical protein